MTLTILWNLTIACTVDVITVISMYVHCQRDGVKYIMQRAGAGQTKNKYVLLNSPI